MPGFTALIKPKPKWKTKVSSGTPFSPGRFDHITSPHPYASPDIVDIRENIASFGSVVDTSTAVIDQQPRLPTPNIKLDLDLTSDPFDTDWFQTQFTASVPSSPSQRGGGLGGEGIRPLGGENHRLGLSERWGPRSVPADDPSDGDDDVDLSTSEDDVLDHLKAMDASTFLNLPPEPRQVIDRYGSPLGKKTPPTPIRIPSLAMYGPQVQIIRSADHNSRPLSEISSADSSAVSGQTLARALLGNSFVLSSDARSSRYRSGFGGLVRSDSATLPRGDHPLLNSPYWRDRVLSGTSDAFAAEPSAPPIPSNADKVYVPPQTPRHSGIEVKKKNNIKRHSSAGSLTSPASKFEFHDTKSRPSSVIDYGEVDKDIQVARRISRISEDPASIPPTPGNSAVPLKSSPGTSPVVPESEEHPLPPLPLESPHHLSDTSSNPKSPAVSSEITASSAKELDNVLDYYSFSDTAEPAAEPAVERPFAPPFSPIIEESSSQLSSPASRRLSHRQTPTGSRAISPLAGTTNGRIDLNSVRRPSDGPIIPKHSSSTLLPIGDRRRSIQMPSHSSSTAQNQVQAIGGMNSSGSISGQRTSLVPPPPLSRVIGGRMRSGSAPSPIKVDRDSRDLNAYKITVSPLHENSLETPSTGDSDGIGVQQTFPETPSAFSPFWSPGSNSPGLIQALPEGYEVLPMPQTPMSATLPGHGRGAPASIEQQILTRAATMVRTRHSRQASVSRMRAGSTGSRMPPKSQASATSTQTGPKALTQDQGATSSETKEISQAVQDPRAHVRGLSEDSVTSSISQYSEPSVEPHTASEGILAGVAPLKTVNEIRQQDSPSQASSVQSSPRLAYLLKDDAAAPEPSSSPPIPPLPSNFHTHRQLPGVEFTDPFKPSVGSSRSNHRSPGFSPHDRTVMTSPPVVITPPAGDSSSPYLNHSLRRISEFSHTLESPPPYDAIAQDHPPPASVTPGSGNSNVEPYFRAASSQNSPPPHHDSSSEYLPLSRKTSNGNRERRQRVRPTGPRRPTSNFIHVTGGRTRNASVSSLASVTQGTSTPNPNLGSPLVPSSNPSTINPPTPNFRLEPSPSSASTTVAANSNSGTTSPKSPKFHIPEVRYRGLTMDQAKWTFTSSQLQTVVSRAIRQSAEASSIRLLRLETLDNDIPQEVQRLEAQKSEIKGKYRSLTRASGSLFAKLNNQISNQAGSNIQRTVEELRDVTRQLNGLTEELHSVDQQQAQIQNLVQLHSASALSMALRKLNASFLKQLAQTQDLQKQVANLEDEVWILNELKKNSPENQHSVQSHVQGQGQGQVAHEAAPGGSTELERKRTLSSVVSRRPSSRVSRAIRMSGNQRLSQRSSMSSAGVRSSMVMGGMSGTNSTFGVPPVPPLPRRRPNDIITDAPTRSATMISTDGGTPNTEIRAMMRAQDELYHVLGMSLRGEGRLRRSHSVIGLPGNPETQPHPSTLSTHPTATVSRPGSLESHSKRASGSNTRPVSYPSSLLDAYNHLDADRNAMLATLEMLSQDD